MKKTSVMVSMLAVALIGCGHAKEQESKTKDGGLSPSTKCEGYHLCQSSESMGHRCDVSGIFNDSNEAYFELKNDDCCSHTVYGGSSIEFHVTSCVLM